MNNIIYPVVLHKERRGYSVTVPDLDGCFTQGEDMDEAIKMAAEAISLVLDGMDSAPNPSRLDEVEAGPGDFVVSVTYVKREQNTF